jgi:hypothetical protein
MSFFKGKTRLFVEKVDLCNNAKKLKDTTQIIVNGFGWNFRCPNTVNKVKVLFNY